MKTNKRRASSGIRHTWARLRPDLLKAARRNRSNAPEDSPKSPGQGIAIGGSRWYQARTGIGKQIIMEILPAHTIIGRRD